MHEDKKQLLQWVEEDHDKLISFLRGFIRAKSPNPPGDTREAAAYVSRFLDNAGLPHKFVAPHEEMPNILASYNCGSPGRRLVLNGHMDVFPVGDGEGWTHNPWSGEIADGKIFGRGACDMKCGTAASIFTFAYLNRIREKLRGSLTLTVVSDEESFGPWGSRYLLEHYTEAIGDCCLNGEPSSPYTLRFGEKGLLWLRLRVHTMGAHGAYTHLSKNAIKIAAHLIAELETLSSIPWRLPEDLAYFKEKTWGHPVIIGRKTWETLDGPLEGREMTVLSRKPGYLAPGCTVAHGVEEALSPYRETPLEVFVAGGQEVYEATLALADRIYLTLVAGEFEGDAFFPSFDANGFFVVEERTPASGLCRFVAYECICRRRK